MVRWGRNTNAGWQRGGLPATLMIKGGCDALTEATDLPRGASPLIRLAAVTALISLPDFAGA